MRLEIKVYGLLLRLLFINPRKGRRCRVYRMHQALYRKWRPRDFDDVCGQDHITSILKKEIETGKINHAYLFCGSRGTGKTSCAKILAKAVNCLDYKDGKVCGKCAACLSADAGTATDIIEMDAASNNGVASIRDIRDEVNYLPSELKYRVYIVDEVHMLSISAFNALLKTLEEPPSHVIFILATTELHKLPSTIVSRCQRFDFRRMSAGTIADRLEHIAKAEGFEVDREAAYSIASIAQGGMRDSISLLELCASGAIDGHVTEEVVAELAGTGDRDNVENTVKAIINRDYDSIFSITSKIYMSSRDISVYWQALTALYRDMLVIKASPGAKEYLDLSDGRFEALKSLASNFDTETLIHHVKILDETYTSMQRGSVNKRIVCECALVRMCDGRLSPTVDALISRVAALERAIEGGAVPARIPATDISKPVAKSQPKLAKTEAKPEVKEAIIKEPEKKAPVSAPTQSTGETRKLRPCGYFGEVVNNFGQLYPMESAFLEDARAYHQDNGAIRIRVDSDIAAAMLRGPEVFDTLLRAFNAYEGGRLDKNTLLIETVAASKQNSYIDEIIESAAE